MESKIKELSNISLTPKVFDEIIASSKDLVVIYSFKKGKDMYIGRTINLQARVKEHQNSPFIDKKRRTVQSYITL